MSTTATMVFAVVFVAMVLIMVSVFLVVRSRKTLVRVLAGLLALFLAVGLVGSVVYLTLFPPAPEGGSPADDSAGSEHPESAPTASSAARPPRRVTVQLDKPVAPTTTVAQLNAEAEEEPQQKWKPLSLEADARLTVDTPEQRERVIVSRKLRGIEQQLAANLDRQSIEARNVTQGFRSHHFDNYEALTKQSTLRVQMAETTIKAMHDKLSVLHEIKSLPRGEVEADKALVLERMQAAEKQRQDYQNALAELRNNEATFRSM